SPSAPARNCAARRGRSPRLQVLPWSVGFGAWRALPPLCAGATGSPCPRRGFRDRGGLLIPSGLRLFLPPPPRPLVIGLAVLALVLITFSRLPLPIVLLALLPLSIALSMARRS